MKILCTPIQKERLKRKVIDSVRDFQKAVEKCIEKNILHEYLKHKTKKAISMRVDGYDCAMDSAVQCAVKELGITTSLTAAISRFLSRKTLKC